MVNKNIIIFGALGQDGTFMCKKLKEDGFDVFGIIKKNSEKNNSVQGINYIETNISKKYEIEKLIKKIKPIEVYNFMGVTNVLSPWDNPEEIYLKNFILPVKLLEAIKLHSIETRFLQSSSSLIFGNTDTNIQTETTKKKPIYHYGYSKYFVDELIKEYRINFNLFLCSAIFYNHESEYRKEHFFTKKVIKQSFLITKGIIDYIELGDLDSYRDFGYAGDYMDACIKIIRHNKPDDYIISSGNKIKLYDFVKIVFDKFNLDMSKNLKINKTLTRKNNLSNLVGDNSKLKSIGWEPSTDLNKIIDIMINHEINSF